MMFNNNKYETIVLRPLAYTFLLFKYGSVVTYESGGQREMFRILCNPVIISAV